MDESLRLITGQISIISVNGTDPLFRIEVGIFVVSILFSLYFTKNIIKSLLVAIASFVGVALFVLLLVKATQDVAYGDLIKSYQVAFASSLFIAALANVITAIGSRPSRYMKPREEPVKPLASYVNNESPRK